MTQLRDLTGQQFAQWTVLRRAPNHDRHTYWVCRCVCGTVKEVKGSHLTGGRSRNCGCVKFKNLRARSYKHGFGNGAEMQAFINARNRCRNPKNKAWADYGGRGIEFRFASFSDFLIEVGPRPSPQHSLDRIDNDGHYEPGNVRWATRKEQAANRRIKRIENFTSKELLVELQKRALCDLLDVSTWRHFPTLI